MLCCICKEKEATVHLTQIAGDKVQKVDLCEECAKQKGVNDPAGFSLADLLLGLGASQEIEQAGGGTTVKCPKCGFTQADFKKSGRLGCAECYVTFSEAMHGLLRAMPKLSPEACTKPHPLLQKRHLRDRLKQFQKNPPTPN